jgi:Tfp pilus assembly protein PilX
VFEITKITFFISQLIQGKSNKVMRQRLKNSGIFMNSKLKLSSYLISGDRGFSLAITMGLGLVMVLLSILVMARSQNNQQNTTIQVKKSKSLAAAETGIARVENFLTRYGTLAAYDHTEWSTTLLGGTVDTGTATTLANLSAGNWIDFNSTSSGLGQYRLVSYDYQAQDTSVGQEHSLPGTATLTIEGRVDQRGSGSNATGDIGTAMTQLKVKLSVTGGTPLFPHLWLNSGTSTAPINSGQARVRGNGRINPSTAADSSLPQVESGSGSAQKSDMVFPALPSGYTVSDAGSKLAPNNPPSCGGTSGPAQGYKMSSGGSINSDLGGGTITLPRTVANQHSSSPVTTDDVPGCDGIYRYQVWNLQIDNGTLAITPGKKVYIYLGDNLECKGTPCYVNHSCDGVTNCKPSDFQILHYRNSGGKFCLPPSSDGRPVEAFMFSKTATKAGSMGPLKGGLWAMGWNDGITCTPVSGPAVISGVQSDDFQGDGAYSLNFSGANSLSPTPGKLGVSSAIFGN